MDHGWGGGGKSWLGLALQARPSVLLKYGF